MKDVTASIGKTIKLIRVRRGLLQAQLARQAGVSVSHLSLVERGERTPSVEVLEKLAAALRVPMNILIFLASDPTELEKLDRPLAERLSHLAWKLIETEDEDAVVPQ